MSRLEYHRQYNITRTRKARLFRLEVKKGQVCKECGESDVKLLSFCHYDRTNKNTELSESKSITTLKNELDKGRFLCVWCHRLETRNELNVMFSEHLGYKYTSEEDDTKPDPFAKTCNGPLCKGKLRSSVFFYKRTNGQLRTPCKKCRSFSSKRKRLTTQEYIAQKKLEISKCQICFIEVTNDTLCCFDFDHLDRNKKIWSISEMGLKTMSKDLINTEIDKCRLLCCKCHRLHTYTQLNYFKPKNEIGIKSPTLNIITV